MGTANNFRSDLYAIHNVIQNTLVTHPKEHFIESLREYFKDDSYYHYVSDEWGFPQTPDLTNEPLEAGYEDDVTTRLFIGEPYRYGPIFYPALLVRAAGSRFTPISFNNNEGTIKWGHTRYVDGYGNETVVQTPTHFIKAGAWEGSINIDIETRDPRARDELVGLVSAYFVDIRRIQLQNAGIFVKGISQGSPSEGDDRNDKLFRQTVTCEIRTEWRREIPVTNIIDMINICVDFGNLEPSPPNLAPNIRVSSNVEFMEAIIDL